MLYVIAIIFNQNCGGQEHLICLKAGLHNQTFIIDNLSHLLELKAFMSPLKHGHPEHFEHLREPVSLMVQKMWPP